MTEIPEPLVWSKLSARMKAVIVEFIRYQSEVDSAQYIKLEVNAAQATKGWSCKVLIRDFEKIT